MTKERKMMGTESNILGVPNSDDSRFQLRVQSESRTCQIKYRILSVSCKLVHTFKRLSCQLYHKDKRVSDISSQMCLEPNDRWFESLNDLLLKEHVIRCCWYICTGIAKDICVSFPLRFKLRDGQAWIEASEAGNPLFSGKFESETKKLKIKCKCKN